MIIQNRFLNAESKRLAQDLIKMVKYEECDYSSLVKVEMSAFEAFLSDYSLDGHKAQPRLNANQICGLAVAHKIESEQPESNLPKAIRARVKMVDDNLSVLCQHNLSLIDFGFEGEFKLESGAGGYDFYSLDAGMTDQEIHDILKTVVDEELEIGMEVYANLRGAGHDDHWHRNEEFLVYLKHDLDFRAVTLQVYAEWIKDLMEEKGAEFKCPQDIKVATDLIIARM